METLLLTGCVDPGDTPFLKVRNAESRLAEYEASIARWIDDSDFESIVFCENSGYEHSYADLVGRARAKGKSLEVLVFKGNRGSQEYGKGYGEGEIIEYALAHSALLGQSSSFYKATGRVFVGNVNSILAKDSGKPTAFILFTSWKYADTRFFKSDIGFFRENLLDAYREVRDREKISIERVYRLRLKGKRIPAFGEFPDIRGICASSGEAYDLSPARMALSRALLKLGLYRV
jgi:hypothetical protein